MRRWALFPLLVAGAVVAEDPHGTQAVEIEVGKTHKLTAPPGSSILCDDTAVVVPEFTEDGNDYVLRGLKPGTTLCGVWLGNMKPGGLYRVTVRKPPPPAAADAGT